MEKKAERGRIKLPEDNSHVPELSAAAWFGPIPLCVKQLAASQPLPDMSLYKFSIEGYLLLNLFRPTKSKDTVEVHVEAEGRQREVGTHRKQPVALVVDMQGTPVVKKPSVDMARARDARCNSDCI